MGQEPNSVKARRRARGRRPKADASQDVQDDEVSDDYVPTTEEQESRLAMLWLRQKEAESFVSWSLGIMSFFVAFVSAGFVVLQIHSPWLLSHFRELKGVVSSFQLVLGIAAVTVCAALNLIIVARPVESSIRALSIISVGIATVASAGWALAFWQAGFLSWWHLWLPLVPPAYSGVCAFLMTEIFAGRSELKRLAKMVFNHETA